VVEDVEQRLDARGYGFLIESDLPGITEYATVEEMAEMDQDINRK
jgi:hypothetical protein